MELKQATLYISGQLGYALALTAGLLIFLEWLMPGSVLPFIDLVDLLPYLAIVFIALMLFKQRQKGIANVVQIILGSILGLALLALLYSNMPSYGLRTIMLAGGGLAIIIVWCISTFQN